MMPLLTQRFIMSKALKSYIAAVEKHLGEYSHHPVEGKCELKFVKYCLFRKQDPAEVANVLSRVRADEDMPTHLLWLSGAWDFVCYQQ